MKPSNVGSSNGLFRDYPFQTKIGRKKKVQTTHEMLNLDELYMVLEVKMNTHFNNPTSVANTSFDFTPMKECHWWKEDNDRGIYGGTPMNTYQDKIYQKCANNEFRNERI